MSMFAETGKRGLSPIVTIVSLSPIVIVLGANTDDVLMGGAGDNILFGGGGNDALYGDGQSGGVSRDWSLTRQVTTSTSNVTTYASLFTNATTQTAATAGNNVLYGQAGDDWAGLAANDDEWRVAA